MHPTHLPFWNVLLLFAKLKRIGLLKSISRCLILPFVVKCTLVFNQGLFHFLSSWTFKIQMHKYKCKCKLVFNITFFPSPHTFKYTNTFVIDKNERTHLTESASLWFIQECATTCGTFSKWQ